jgi:hypothetical protein
VCLHDWHSSTGSDIAQLGRFKSRWKIANESRQCDGFLSLSDVLGPVILDTGELKGGDRSETNKKRFSRPLLSACLGGRFDAFQMLLIIVPLSLSSGVQQTL